MMALKNAWRSVSCPSANSLAITVLAARAEPKLMTKVEAETAGRWDMEMSGLARWLMRENAFISTMRPARKSMIKTVIIVETVSSSVCRSKSSIIKSFLLKSLGGILYFSVLLLCCAVPKPS